MRIDRLEVFQISIPFIEPFRFGTTSQEHRDHIIVSLSSEGLVGWGESGLLRWPYYNSETTSGAFQLICELLAPLVVGKELSHPQGLQRYFAPVLGNSMAQAAIDFAVWDLFSKREGVPLSTFLGGSRRSVSIGVSLGKRATQAEFFAAVDSSLKKGFTRVKCKISPGFPIEWLEQLTSDHPELLLTVDANASFGEEHFEELRRYDALSLAMIEQPFHPKAFLLSAELQKSLKTDICLDESVEDLHDLKLAASLKAARILNIKPARVGGLTNSLHLRDLCLELGWKVWVGGLMETGIGRAANLAFASTLDDSFPHDIAECGRYATEELIHETFAITGSGELEVPVHSPGIGVSVNMEVLKAHTVNSQSFAA